MTAKKNRDTERARKLWEATAEASKKVADWPSWKRGESSPVENPTHKDSDFLYWQ